MAYTPFLKSISNDGGTLYVFPSASTQLSSLFSSSDYTFKFSHFACLNLPDIYIPQDDNNDTTTDKGLWLKKMYYTGDDQGSHSISTSSDGIGKVITEEIQNYVMNFETAILNGMGDDDGYNNDVLTTVSEKVFFNWLQKIGGIQFDGDEENYENLADRTVQYIGNIDIMNTVEINGDSFEELYIHIPSTVGASTKVYFKKGSETDEYNYVPNHKYILKNTDNNDYEKYLIGRSGSSGYKTPEDDSEICCEPIFDSDNGENAYVADEGHTINFSDSVYADGDGISTMNGKSSDSFEFNAVLIYYDYINNATNEKATNLFGILFLDNVTDLSDGNSRVGYFQRYPKVKETTYGSGNSFSLKLDLKIVANGGDNDVDSTVSYQDPNTLAMMAAYDRAYTSLQNCVDYFFEQKNQLAQLEQRISTIETMITGIDKVSDLDDRLTRLYNLYDGMNLIDMETLLGLIENNSKKLNSLLKGEKNIKVQYDASAVKSGNGIKIDNDTDTGKITINATDKKYSIVQIYNDSKNDTDDMITSDTPLNTNSGNYTYYLELANGENLGVMYFRDEGYLKQNVEITVKTTDEIKWTTGQSLKICFVGDEYEDRFDFNDGYGIIMKTGDVTSKILGAGKEITELEMVCIDADKNNFVYWIK